jgi:hypothetical protein
MRKAQAQDWIEDLEEFGPAIVAEACRTWRRRPVNRRPSPGEIRALCLNEQREQRERAQHAQLSGPDAMDAYARSVGFANNAERMAQIRRDEAKRDDPAHYERLKALQLEIQPRPVGSLRKAKEASPEELRRGRIELGLEIDPETERLRRENIEQERANRDRPLPEAAE